jgi:hypothetical protein
LWGAAQRYPDTAGTSVLVPPYIHRFGHGFQHPFGHHRAVAGIGNPFQQDREFVTAQASH